jgi:hypothetical protein
MDTRRATSFLAKCSANTLEIVIASRVSIDRRTGESHETPLRFASSGSY